MNIASRTAGWRDAIARQLASLPADAGPPWLAQLLTASEFAYEVLRREPSLVAELADLVADVRAPDQRWRMPDQEFSSALRRFRRRESLRLIARDLLGLDDVVATLHGSSELADTCIALALEQACAETAERHGVPRNDAGHPSRPVVYALGKLGGGELNFSSDVDLVFAYTSAAAGQDSDGARPIAADAWHARVVQRTAQLLGQVTVDGFSHRVDLRLRPFGQSGKPSLPLAAMEQYFQREGRDWERYAWLKARAVAGDVTAGEAFLAELRPFVYRRYLDYAAIDSLREMKAQIDAEVRRQDRLDDIKLGRGGIREIEFLVQVVQLVRGGREPSLRQRSLLAALAACAASGYIARDRAGRLREAYLFLRRLENRLQMLRDAQTQALPENDGDRERIAEALGFSGWPALLGQLSMQRDFVAGEFAQVLAPRPGAALSAAASDMLPVWRGFARDGAVATLEQAGVQVGAALQERLRALAGSPAVRDLSARASGRLDRLMAALLQRLAGGEGADEAAIAIVELLQVLLRRSNYLALLEQQPAALQRLFDLAHGSRWLVRQLTAEPLLLDDVFDPRAPSPPDDAGIEAAFAAVAESDDVEGVLAALAGTRNSLHFRLGLAMIDRRLPAVVVAARLARVAQAVLDRVLALALAEVARQHGWPGGASPLRSGLALIGYGSFGARELGFASDLDLVFVFDDAFGTVETEGGRSVVEGQRFYARAVQKLIAFLAVPLPGGSLYEIDARLRPDGAKGLLVTGLEGYAAYQRDRAWTWEQQALVRARFVAGDTVLGERFTALRAQALAQARDATSLREAVGAMRERLRRERDRSSVAAFDLKQGRGGLVDLEFLLQYLVLLHAAAHPSLLNESGSAALLSRFEALGLIEPDTATRLRSAHEHLLGRALACTLDARPRVAPPDAALDVATAAIADACARTFHDG